MKRFKKIMLSVLCAITLMCAARAEEVEGVLNLQNAIDLALKNSKNMTTLKYREQLAKSIITEKWRSFIPDISLSYQKDDAVAYREDDYRTQSATIDMSYDIYTNGKTAAEYRIAKIDSLLAGTEYKIEKNNVTLDVKKKYYDLIKAHGEIEINKKLHESLLLQKKVITQEQKLGMATQLQMVQIEARLSEAEYAVRISENEYKNRLKDLMVLIGYRPMSPIVLQPVFNENTDILPPDMSDEDIIAVAIANRNELKKSSYSILKTKEVLKLAQLYFMPQITVNGSYGYTGEKFPMNQMKWSVGVTIKTNLFGNTISGGQKFGESDNGNTRTSATSGSASVYDSPSYVSNKIQAEADFKEVQLTNKLLKNAISIEVIRARDSVIESRERMQISQKNVEMVDKQAVIENEKARLGEITMKDLMDTYIELAKARQRLLASQTDYLLSVAVLENSLGYSIGVLKENRQ